MSLCRTGRRKHNTSFMESFPSPRSGLRDYGERQKMGVQAESNIIHLILLRFYVTFIFYTKEPKSHKTLSCFFCSFKHYLSDFFSIASMVIKRQHKFHPSGCVFSLSRLAFSSSLRILSPTQRISSLLRLQYSI